MPRINERGAALIMALAYLSAMSLFATVFHSMVIRSIESTHRHERTLTLQNLCEGGIELALARLTQDAAYTGEDHRTLGEGLITIHVTRTAETGRAALITSTAQLMDGTDERARMTLHAQVAFTASGAVQRVALLEELQ